MGSTLRRPWMKVGLSTFVLAITLPALAALASSGPSQVSFHAIGPAGLAFDGKGGDVKVHEAGGKVEVVVGLNSLHTGISLRDRHMKEKYLETGKYPTAKFQVDKGQLRFPSDGHAVKANGTGKLTLHGVTRNVQFAYTAKGTANDATVDGSAKIKMTDFGIEVPSYLGITVKPNVDISVEFGVKE